MKKTLIIITLLSLWLSLFSCGKAQTQTGESSQTEEPVSEQSAERSESGSIAESAAGEISEPGANETPAQSEETSTDNSKDEIKSFTLFQNLTFESGPLSDRGARDANVFVMLPSIENKIENALCLVTILDIDSSKFVPDKPNSAHITIRIDEIYNKNSTFRLNVGDTLIVADFTQWWIKDEKLHVEYKEPTIPITEVGAQYIAQVFDGTQRRPYFWDDLDYVCNTLTIPIVKNADLTNEEIYKILKLPDDVVRCSEDLIAMFIDK